MNIQAKICSVLLVMMALSLSGQSDAYYSKGDSKGKKYLVSGGYGWGSSDWISNNGSAGLYDKGGNLIPSQNGHFKANNATNCSNLEVAAPFAGVRLGLGISFENNYLEELTLTGNSFGSGGNKIIFDQKFGFEKIYAHIEVPFKMSQPKNYQICFKGNVGFFGYSGGSAHPDFFGGNELPSTFYTGVGMLADYRIARHVYAFLNPMFEYNYFKNTSDFDYSAIVHNIINFSLIAGLRFDVSRD